MRYVECYISCQQQCANCHTKYKQCYMLMKIAKKRSHLFTDSVVAYFALLKIVIHKNEQKRFLFFEKTKRNKVTFDFVRLLESPFNGHKLFPPFPWNFFFFFFVLSLFPNNLLLYTI